MSVESQAPDTVAPEAAVRTGRVHLWFTALGRALLVVVVTLGILALLGYAADVALHHVTRTSHVTSSYDHIYEVDVIVDGDGSVAVTGTPSAQHNVTLHEDDTSTTFGHPQRATSLIGGTLYIAVHCPDSLCSTDLNLTATPDTHVNIRVGNALRLDKAAIDIRGMTGPVNLSAWPANVTVAGSTSTVTGMVAGSLQCGEPAVCIVQIPR
ncbi:MAG: hypothetical protein ACRDSS_06790 [Actinocrinis sp.]